MSTIDANQRPYHERYRHASHFRTDDEEFDAVKLGIWLFLATEVLLFSGMFCVYAVFRMLYPEAFANGSHYLNIRYGTLNTVILLLSSFSIAMGVHNAQRGQQFWLKFNLLFTAACGVLFLAIKFFFEYVPKWAVGKRPGFLFDYPFAHDPQEPLWWGIYYGATGIHATHVLVGVVLLLWLWTRAQRKHFGPNHYTAVEGVGLYWHIVDVVWIFLFPLLYLID